VRTSDNGLVIYEETFEGYRNWTEASSYYTETDAGAVCTPSIGYDPYSATGQRKHLLLTINNTSGTTQTASVGHTGFGVGVWVPNTVITINTVVMSFRYKASAGLSGATVTAVASNSFFSGTVAVAVTADGEWHEASGDWSMQADSVGAAGYGFLVTGITNGMTGTLQLDDFRITRADNIMREIDSVCPVVPFRCDWADGFRETYGWVTEVERAEDGSEFRESLRMIPTCRLEYTVLATDPSTSGFIEQWLYLHHGAVVAVPRWQDAVRLAAIEDSGHTIQVQSPLADGWFQERQRVLLWSSETNYEDEIVNVFTGAATISLAPLESQVTGTYPVGTTFVVPLMPARLVSSVALGRPNSSMGRYPLVFDVQMVQ
jgi:hypothetical protein